MLEVSDRDRGQRSAQPSVLTGYEGRNMLASPSRIAFSTLAFPEVTLATAVSLGRSWGYAGVELRLVDGELIEGSMPAATRTEVKRTVAAASLPIVAVDSSIRLTGDDPGPELRQFLELASDWEAPLVRVFGGALPVDEHARRSQLPAAARVLEAAAGVAERLGVAVGVETHDAFSASSVVAELLAMVDSPWVGAVWDSHHPHRMDEQPAEIYQNIGRRTLLAQVKDARRAPAREDGWQLVLLGEGEVPVREMLRLLAAGGYEGWISVEWEKRWHPEIEEPQVALPQHLKLLETWMHELEEAG
ncbi:MAG TPA: sugar phosphate isomerase/epimerase family protein [Streptosporangiaceae bacterium]|nr:sugar phosphate isomerase/epimerase family protein [Streptosporangiaceae bacterium]